MAIWTVQARPGGPPEHPDVVLVKEGFSWPALIFGPFWFAYQGMWRGLGLYAAALVVLAGVLAAANLSEEVDAVANLALAVLFAAQASDMRRASLARSGFLYAGIVRGGRVAAEHAALSHWPPARLVAGCP